jgi:thiol-disulfide isomerase/thioredoxin
MKAPSMRSTNTRVLALLASLACFLTAPVLAGSEPVPILAVDKAPLAIPGAETKGHRLTAVHFWAIWCIPCLKELPEVDTTASTYKNKDFRVVAISLDTDMAKVQQFFTDNDIKTLTPLIDKNNAAFLASKLKGLPGTLFFNKNGELIARADGPVDWKTKATMDFIELPR